MQSSGGIGRGSAMNERQAVGSPKRRTRSRRAMTASLLSDVEVDARNDALVGISPGLLSSQREQVSGGGNSPNLLGNGMNASQLQQPLTSSMGGTIDSTAKAKRAKQAQLRRLALARLSALEYIDNEISYRQAPFRLSGNSAPKNGSSSTKKTRSKRASTSAGLLSDPALPAASAAGGIRPGNLPEPTYAPAPIVEEERVDGSGKKRLVRKRAGSMVAFYEPAQQEAGGQVSQKRQLHDSHEVRLGSSHGDISSVEQPSAAQASQLGSLQSSLDSDLQGHEDVNEIQGGTLDAVDGRSASFTEVYVSGEAGDMDDASSFGHLESMRMRRAKALQDHVADVRRKQGVFDPFAKRSEQSMPVSTPASLPYSVPTYARERSASRSRSSRGSDFSGLHTLEAEVLERKAMLDVWKDSAVQRMNQLALHKQLRQSNTSARDLDRVILNNHLGTVRNLVLEQTANASAYPLAGSARSSIELLQSPDVMMEWKPRSPSSAESRASMSRSSLDESSLSSLTGPGPSPVLKGTQGSGSMVSSPFWAWKDRKSGELDRFQRAAIYIRDAQLQQHVRVHRTGRAPTSVYLFHSSPWWRQLIVVALLIDMIVLFGSPVHTLLEQPSCMGDVVDSGGIGANTGSLRAILAIQALCTTMFVLDSFLNLYHMGVREFFKRLKNRFEMAFAAIAAIDLIMCAVLSKSYSRILFIAVPLLFVVHTSGVRRTMSNLGSTVLKAMPVLGCLMVFLVIFTVVGVTLFGDQEADIHRDQGSFQSHGLALLSLAMLITTENYPDVAAPFQRQSGWAIIFFVSFIVLGTFLLMSVFVGVVFRSHRNQLKEMALRNRVVERKALMAAFFTLDTAGNGVLEYGDWVGLMNIVNPHTHEGEIEIMFQCIDQDGNGTIDLMEFFQLCDILLLRFQWEGKLWRTLRDMPFVRRCIDWVEQNIPRAKLRKLFADRRVQFSELAAVVLFVAFTVANKEAELDSIDGQCSPFGYINYVIIVLFVVANSAKVTAFGPRSYFQDSFNVLDSLCVLSGFISLCMAGSVGVCRADNIFHTLLQSFLSLRLVVLIPVFKNIIKSLVAYAQLLGAVGGVLLVIVLVYTLIGTELMGRCRFKDDTPDFQTYVTAFLTLFQVISSSNWHDLLLGAMLKFEESASMVSVIIFFFISFYFTVTLLLLNLLLSVVVDAVMMAQEESNEEHVLIHAADAGEDANLEELSSFEGSVDDHSIDSTTDDVAAGDGTDGLSGAPEQALSKKGSMKSKKGSLKKGSIKVGEDAGVTDVQIRTGRRWSRDLVRDELNAPEMQAKEMQELKKYVPQDRAAAVDELVEKGIPSDYPAANNARSAKSKFKAAGIASQFASAMLNASTSGSEAVGTAQQQNQSGASDGDTNGNADAGMPVKQPSHTSSSSSSLHSSSSSVLQRAARAASQIHKSSKISSKPSEQAHLHAVPSSLVGETLLEGEDSGSIGSGASDQELEAEKLLSRLPNDEGSHE